jgi:hypothetical protein
MSKLTRGGALMSKNVKVPLRTGPASTNKMNPAGVAQLGTRVGTRKAVEPRKSGTAPQVPLGNAIAGNVGKGGPGTGRTLYGQSGTQGRQGPVAGHEAPAGRSILGPPGGKQP